MMLKHIRNLISCFIRRAHVHYVVTEYGIANLWGKSLVERAEALTAIAHPDHRDTIADASMFLLLLSRLLPL